MLLQLTFNLSETKGSEGAKLHHWCEKDFPSLPSTLLHTFKTWSFKLKFLPTLLKIGSQQYQLGARLPTSRSVVMEMIIFIIMY